MALSADLEAGQYYGAVSSSFETPLAVLSEVVHATPRSLPEHDHALPYFCMLVHGNYSETTVGQEFEYRPFDVVFHPAHLPHRDRIASEGGRFLCLEVRAESLAEFDVRLRAVPALLPSVVTLQLLRVYRGFNTRTLSSLALEGAVWELCGDASEEPTISERRFPRWLRRCLDYIEDESATDLKLTDIAARASVHPVHLSREFRRRFGQTVGEYVHKVRVRLACAMMSRGETTLAHVAASTGFADHAHFCRVFKSLVGCTPSMFLAAGSAKDA
jgi:AraC family transcriptional regulator